jgi:excisionase family DNA binding protein
METEILKEFRELKELLNLQKNVFTLAQAAAFLGISRSHVYKLCLQKKIGFYKSGGGKLSFFERQELEKWALSNRVKPQNEIETEAANYCITGNKKGGAK